jgi:hypothetical protein
MDQSAPQSPLSPPDEREDQYAAASQSTAEFIKNVEPIQAQHRKQRRRKPVIIIVLLLLAAAGASAYFFLKPAEKQSTTQPSPSPSSQNSEEAEEEDTEHYVSQDLRLALDYPKAWKLDDATSGQIKIESPMVKLPDASNSQTDAKILVTFLSAGSTPPEFTNNDATATIEAEKITYKNPSQTQRGQTYLSFVGFGSSTGLDAIYVTGDAGYQKDQTIPKSDVVRANPIISVTFQKCAGSTCTGKLSVAPDAWSSNKDLKSTKTILESLIFE